MPLQKHCIDCGKVLTGHGGPKRCRACGARQGYVTLYGRPPEIIISKCAACGKVFSDYASNRRKGKVHLCSTECRVNWTAVSNSVRRGWDGKTRTKSEKDHIDYIRHSDQRRAKATQRYWANREHILENCRTKDWAIKKAIIDAYGGKCECCGESIPEFLTIDHVNNDGAAHRRKVGRGRNLYKDLLRMGCPKDSFRLLCFNCNIVLGFRGYCPHNPTERRDISTLRVSAHPGRKRSIV